MHIFLFMICVKIIMAEFSFNYYTIYERRSIPVMNKFEV